ncbi:MAG: acyl-CoA dehydrogenase family protein [Planctomycetaceae bacterium]
MTRRTDFQTLEQQLRELPACERTDEWPTAQFEALKQAGGLRWNIGPEFGGDGLSSAEMLSLYRQLASASLVTTFILTQRNAACQRIALARESDLRTKLLTQLCEGAIFSTVGISHLTTSRQHLKSPPVSVTVDGSDYVLNGVVPWATGATMADVLVTGGTLFDQTQILAAIPAHRAGVSVGKPVEMLALNSSQTGAIHLQNVRISAEEVLHGPVEKVMSQGAGGGAGSLGTSALAIGAAEGTIRQFEVEVEKRPELAEFILPLKAEANRLVLELERAAEATQDAGTQATEVLRRDANSLVTRSAQVWLAATKGAGFIAGHPAERAVRESMFFMVWSCPQPVLNANLKELSCRLNDE